IGNTDRFLMATGEQLRFMVAAVPIDRPNRVNDVLRRKMPGAGDHRPSSRQAAVRRNVLPALIEDSGATVPMDSTVNPSSAQERRIRRVYDRIGRLLRYVSGTTKLNDLV